MPETGWVTLAEIQDLWGDPGRVEGPLGMSVMGQRTLEEVQDWLGNHRGGPGRFEGL